MIDMENKTIYFGYGDICVNYTLNSIRFIEIIPPVEVGQSIPYEIMDRATIKSVITIKLNTIEKLIDFRNTIKTINGKDCLQCTYNDYILDFSNYNKKSINVLLTQLEKLIQIIILPIAC